MLEVEKLTYNELTGDCSCKCGNSWKSRTSKIPVKCPSCGSRLWNSDTRSFTSLISRAGTGDPKTGYRQFCEIDYVEAPAVVTDRVFYVSKKDIDKYIGINRYPVGSAVVWVGEMSIGADKLLRIDSLKLIYCHEATFFSYHSSVTCMFNVKSFYERAKALKRYEEDKLVKEQQEEAKREAAVTAARARLDAARARDLKVAEAERMLEDDTVSNTDKMAAIALLRK